MQKLIIALILLLTTACTSAPVPSDPNVVSQIPEDEYKELLDDFTRNDKQYRGFYNTYELHATPMNSAVTLGVLQRKGHFLRWTLDEARAAREKAFQEMSSSAKYVMSFYSPEPQYDDLDKPDTIWRFYLELDGTRYEGKVKRVKDLKLAELVHLFPYHNRWSTPYEITFNVPMSAVERANHKLIVTSTLGTTQLEFPPAESASF